MMPCLGLCRWVESLLLTGKGLEILKMMDEGK